MNSTACETPLLSSDAFLHTKTLQMRTCSLLANKTYLNTVRLFSYDRAKKKETLLARVKARGQRVARAVKQHFSVKDEPFPARAANRRSLLFTLGDSRRLGTCASIQHTLFNLGLALRTSLHKKRLHCFSCKDYKIMISVSASGKARDGEAPKVLRGAGGWKKSAFSVKTLAVVERTRVKGRKLEQGRFAD